MPVLYISSFLLQNNCSLPPQQHSSPPSFFPLFGIYYFFVSNCCLSLATELAQAAASLNTDMDAKAEASQNSAKPTDSGFLHHGGPLSFTPCRLQSVIHTTGVAQTTSLVHGDSVLCRQGGKASPVLQTTSCQAKAK